MFSEGRSESCKTGNLISINPSEFSSIVFFTGAGMSAESGIPTYRGKGGIWNKYNWQEYACEKAFQKAPQKVLEFHEMRRKKVLSCKPHPGYEIITKLEKSHPNITIITQNIDGLHQRSGSNNVIELHGSLWRLRCPSEEINFNDSGKKFKRKKCKCGSWLRPDIIWFGDNLNKQTIQNARDVCKTCDLFISIGTSGVVYPAASLPVFANGNGALMIEINPAESESSYLFKEKIRETSTIGLKTLFSNEVN